MIEIKDIEKLAALSRLELSDIEKTKFQKDIGAILDYVNQIQEASSLGGAAPKAGLLRNVMRPDIEPIEPGIHTEDIVREFPQKEGNYLKVKKIIT